MPRSSAWKEAIRFSFGQWRISILVLIPAAGLSRSLHLHPVIGFGAAALALVPFASLLGDATEQLSGHIGATVGGLLNASVGNVTELIFGVIVLLAGHTQVL